MAEQKENQRDGKAKQSRRGHVEGSIYQRKSDGRFTASLTLENGKRKYFYGESKAEVRGKLEKARYEQKQGILAVGPQQKLKDYLEHWLEDAHKPTVRLTSYVKYRGHLDNHILPALGHIQLQRLTRQQIQSFYAHMFKKGLSPTTIGAIHRLLHRALEEAVEGNLIPRNVSDKIKLPRRIQREFRTLTKEQAQHMLEVAKGFRMEAVLTLAITTGMRQGELLALRWSDVDFDEGSLHICRSLSFIAGHGYEESEPKTQRSKSKILLPRIVIDVLKQHRIRQFEERLSTGAAWQDRNLVFCTAEGGFFQPSSLHRRFQTVLKASGLPHMRFHDLRHSTATLLLDMGVHPKIAQDILRHSHIDMTMNTYTHVLPSMQREAMDKMDDLFKG